MIAVVMAAILIARIINGIDPAVIYFDLNTVVIGFVSAAILLSHW